MSKKIEVTVEHIENAVPRDSNRCMIVEAIKDHYRVMGKPVKNVMVDTQTIRYTKDGKRYIKLTPPKIQQTIIDWDDGIKPEPFHFWDPNPIQIIPTQSRRAGVGDGDAKVKMRVRKEKVGKNKEVSQTKIDRVIVHGGQPPRRGLRSFGLRNMRPNQ